MASPAVQFLYLYFMFTTQKDLGPSLRQSAVWLGVDGQLHMCQNLFVGSGCNCAVCYLLYRKPASIISACVAICEFPDGQPVALHP